MQRKAHKRREAVRHDARAEACKALMPQHPEDVIKKKSEGPTRWSHGKGQH